MNEPVPAWPLTILRIYAGLMFIGAAVVQLGQPGGLPMGSLELIVGAALLLGVGTPAAATVGAGIVIAYVLPVHTASILVSPGPRTALMMLLVTVALSRAGRVFGLDGLLSGRKPGGPPRWTLVLLRVYLGAAFLKAATGKIGANWEPWPGWLAGVIQDRLPGSFPLYGGFLKGVVLPHIGLFAHGVAIGEATVGCLLLVGLATRAAAAGGILLTANYLLLNGLPQLLPGHDPLFRFGSNDPVFILGCLALLIGSAGRALGVDFFLHRRFPTLLVS